MHPARRPSVAPAWLAAAALLAGCSSVPLPPDPATSGQRPVPAPMPVPAPPSTAPAPPAAVPRALPPAATPPAVTAQRSLPPPPGAPWPPTGALAAPLGTGASGTPLQAWRVSPPGAPEGAAIVVVAPPHDLDAAAALARAAQRLASGGARTAAQSASIWFIALDEAAAVAPTVTAATTFAQDHLLLRGAEAAAVARFVRERAPVALVQLRTQEPWTEAPAVLRLGRSGTPALHEFTRRAVDEWLRQPALDALTRDGVAVSAPTPAPEPGASLLDAAALRHVAAVEIVGSAAAARDGSLATALVRVLEAAARRTEDFDKVRRYVDQETATRPCGKQAPAAAGVPARACGWWLAVDAKRALDTIEAQGITVERVRVNETRLGQMASQGGGSLLDAAIDLPAGSAFVPAQQPLGDLAAALLDPASPAGVLAAGLATPAQLARITVVPTAAPAPAIAPATTTAPAPLPDTPADRPR